MDDRYYGQALEYVEDLRTVYSMPNSGMRPTGLESVESIGSDSLTKM